MNAGLAIGLLSLTSLVSGQNIQLENLRFPLGVYGSSRPANQDWLPGDLALLSFDLTGLKTVAPGRAFYGVGLTLIGPDGKILVEQEARPNEAYLPLGGGRVPAYAACELPFDLPPGAYTVNLIAKDFAAKTEGKATKKLQVGAKKFGVVRVNNTFATGEAAPNYGLPGQQFVLRFSLANCAFDPKTLRGKLELRIRILDESGKSLMDKPLVTEINDILDETARLCPCTYPYQPNRPGRFQIEIEAVDQLSSEKSSAKMLYPLVIIEPK